MAVPLALVRTVTLTAYMQAVAAIPLWLAIPLGLVVAEIGSSMCLDFFMSQLLALRLQ